MKLAIYDMPWPAPLLLIAGLVVIAFGGAVVWRSVRSWTPPPVPYEPGTTPSQKEPIFFPVWAWRAGFWLVVLAIIVRGFLTSLHYHH